MGTKEFLETIHGNNPICFRCIDSYAKNISGYYDKEMENELQQLNTEGCNIYFVVNAGGTKSSEINRITAVYIDYDAGKDENNKYLSLDDVDRYKKERLEFINTFKHKPSMIVETRNGLHVYWLINEGATMSEFEECQLRLINYFHSDSAVKTPERLMRLPNYYWMKDKDNPFMVNIIQDSGKRYDISEIIDSLPTSLVNKTKSKVYGNTPNVKPQINSNNIELIMNKDIEGLRNRLKSSYLMSDVGVLGGIEDISSNNFILLCPLNSPLIVKNRAALFDVLCKIDLASFLGVGKRMMYKCVFHNDNNPSANIFIDAETGHHIYKCFSSSCDFVATIIKVVERLQRCRKSEAINFIKQVYNIELEETAWQIETKQMLQSNIEYMLSGLMEVEYPVLNQRLLHYIPELITLHEIAIMNVTDEPYSSDGSIVFYSTLHNIASLMGKIDEKKVSQRLNLFAFLKLVEKLSEDKIPEMMLKKAKHLAGMKKHHNIPNFLSIPSYDYGVLSIAESKANDFRDRNMAMTGFSRDMILRVYGEEEANRVFPQLKGRGFSKVMQEFSYMFDHCVIERINFQGYASESEIFASLRGNKDENKKKIKRVLQETLDKYGLKRIRSNKELKTKYGITKSGYPFFIVKNDDEMEG
jgi:hypothetical protein